MAPPDDGSGCDGSRSCRVSDLEDKPSLSHPSVIRPGSSRVAGRSTLNDFLASKGQRRRCHRSGGTTTAVGNLGVGQPPIPSDATTGGRGCQKHSLVARGSLL